MIVNVLIDFLLFVMHWKVFGRETISHCNVKLVPTVIFLNEQIKEMRRQKAKRHGCPFQIPSRIQIAMKLVCIK